METIDQLKNARPFLMLLLVLLVLLPGISAQNPPVSPSAAPTFEYTSADAYKKPNVPWEKLDHTKVDWTKYIEARGCTGCAITGYSDTTKGIVTFTGTHIVHSKSGDKIPVKDFPPGTQFTITGDRIVVSVPRIEDKEEPGVTRPGELKLPADGNFVIGGTNQDYRLLDPTGKKLTDDIILGPLEYRNGKLFVLPGEFSSIGGVTIGSKDGGPATTPIELRFDGARPAAGEGNVISFGKDKLTLRGDGFGVWFPMNNPYLDGSPEMTFTASPEQNGFVEIGGKNSFSSRTRVHAGCEGCSGTFYASITDGPFALRLGEHGSIKVRAKEALSSRNEGLGAMAVPISLTVEGVNKNRPLLDIASSGTVSHTNHVEDQGNLRNFISSYWMGKNGPVQFPKTSYDDYDSVVASHLVSVGKNQDGSPVKMVSDAAAALERVKEAYGRTIVFGDTRGGFRSTEDQQKSWERNIHDDPDPEEYFRRTGRTVHPGKVAVPGYSQHGTGGAVDISKSIANDPEFARLMRQEGFVRAEHWENPKFFDEPHYTYIGTEDLGREVRYFPSPSEARGGGTVQQREPPVVRESPTFTPSPTPSAIPTPPPTPQPVESFTPAPAPRVSVTPAPPAPVQGSSSGTITIGQPLSGGSFLLKNKPQGFAQTSRISGNQLQSTNVIGPVAGKPGWYEVEYGGSRWYVQSK